jgi:transposase InsO family protein
VAHNVRLQSRPHQETFAFTVFERTFREFGLPHVIRTDNGVPFASAHAIYGLSKLAVWWLRLGIQIERIAPGHPQQNGRHERMHLTLKRRSDARGVTGALCLARPAMVRRGSRSDDGTAGPNRVKTNGEKCQLAVARLLEESSTL